MTIWEWLQLVIGMGLIASLVVMAWGVTRHSRRDSDL